MVNTRIDDDRDAEIVPLIGIPRKWANPTLKFYSFIFLGYSIWITYQEFGTAAKNFKAKLSFLVPHLAAFSVFEAVTVIAIIQIWDIIMYLTNRFKTDIEKIKAASEAQGRVEGKAEAYQVWADWYHRQENARKQGIPFDEPPPSLNGDETKA